MVTAHLVAPLAGAWIEIGGSDSDVMMDMSLLSQERGLKYLVEAHQLVEVASLLSQERGLKFFIYI